jgi:hypothetical protein
VSGALVEKGIFRATDLFCVGGLINSPLASLGLVAEHTRALVAYVVVLGCPLTHLCLQECDLIASECDSSALHREVASSGTR